MITIAGKVDNSLVSNAFSFLRLPLNFEPYDSDFDWVITGIPFDLATSGRSGSRYGPRAIRQISTHLAWGNCRWPWDFNFRDYLKIVDCGDLIFNFGDIIDFCNKLQRHAERLLINGKHMLSFGGDHYITLPLLRAYFKKYGKLAVIDFDAHTDTYFTDSMYDHGSVFFYASKEGLIDVNHSVQIGIRTQFRQKSFFNVFDMESLANISILDKIIDQIKDLVDSKYVYLTFDIDCLDPSIAPGTGTPVIGGLTSLQALKLIRGLKDLNIVGMDIVELAPSYDTSEITALVAATLVLEMLYIQVAK